MGRVYYKLWAHLVWTTKYREPVLTKTNRFKIYQHIRKRIEAEKIWIDTMNGTEDHVHCLICYHPKIAISRILNIMKGESSHWANENQLFKDGFNWQKGYACFSVSESNIKRVRQYIKNQEIHHRKISLVEELEMLRLKHHSNQIEE